MEKALGSIASMIERSENARGKFSPGVAQHTLLTNRIGALKIAASLIKAETTGESVLGLFDKSELEKALAPIESLISKSEKARGKLAHETWQYKMLSDNLEALNIALPLLIRALKETRQ